MQCLNGRYIMDNNTYDFAKEYFDQKNNYHYYDEEDKKKIIYIPKSMTYNHDSYELFNGDNVTDQNIHLISLADKIIIINKKLQKLADKMNGTMISKANILYIYSTIYNVCKSMEVPSNILNQYIIIAKRQILNNVGNDKKLIDVVERLTIPYLIKVTE